MRVGGWVGEQQASKMTEDGGDMGGVGGRA